MSKRTERDQATVDRKTSGMKHRGISPRVNELVEGLHDLCDALEAGAPLEQVATVRTYQIDFTLPDLSPTAIRTIRESLGLSQTLFAAFLGVGLPTVRSWEQGQRQPSAMARRFLGEIRDDPKYWRGKLARAVVRRNPGAGHPNPCQPA